MTEEKSKRDIVKETIEEGNATMESLTKAADCKYESVMSIFSMLRLMGHCPVKDVPHFEDPETMTYRFVDADEWERMKAERSANSQSSGRKLTPEERLEKAQTRVEKSEKAYKKAKERAENGNSEILDLRAEKAKIEHKIAQHELSEAQIEAQKEPVEA